MARAGHREQAADDHEPGRPADPESVARIVCLRLLDRRARTRVELETALRAKGVPDDAATTVLDRFTEVGLIDDRALATGYALSQHRERGLAGRAVAVKLRHRGVAEPVVQAALGQIDRDSELATARTLVARRMRALSGLAPEARARRLVALLARKGYPVGLAHQVVRESVRAAGLDTADLDAADLDTAGLDAAGLELDADGGDPADG